MEIHGATEKSSEKGRLGGAVGADSSAAGRGTTVAGKIYDLGVTRFPEDPDYLIECLYHHLVDLDDQHNARAFFERTLVANKMTLDGVCSFWQSYLDYVYLHGDAQTRRLMSSRFREALAGHPQATDLAAFARMYTYVSRAGTVALLSPVSPQAGERLSFSTSRMIRRPPVFHVPKAVQNLMERLPRSSKGAPFTGPSIDCEQVIEALLTGRTEMPYSYGRHGNAPGRPQQTRAEPPVEIKAPRAARKRRPEEEDDTPDVRNAPTRPDDIFALRRLPP
jgi:hypothetical protein